MVFTKLTKVITTSGTGYTDSKDDSQKSQGVQTESTVKTRPWNRGSSFRTSFRRQITSLSAWRKDRGHRREVRRQSTNAYRENFKLRLELNEESEAIVFIENIRFRHRGGDPLDFDDIDTQDFVESLEDAKMWPELCTIPEVKFWSHQSDKEGNGLFVIERGKYPVFDFIIELVIVF
ncbi:hypothetical protein TWF694_000344 [Orbilia ellipsospora]|uniref:Uncharacterized protein n=1 Tax=Orbilia ellipsospora TaxID=2528407 RepID=A0AAV9XNB7_9PEZI